MNVQNTFKVIALLASIVASPVAAHPPTPAFAVSSAGEVQVETPDITRRARLLVQFDGEIADFVQHRVQVREAYFYGDTTHYRVCGQFDDPLAGLSGVNYVIDVEGDGSSSVILPPSADSFERLGCRRAGATVVLGQAPA